MIERQIKNQLVTLAASYPVVAVLGPRQAGKTTLIKKTFPHKPYVNLEYPDIRLLAQTDPRRFLQNYPEGAILDEIQRAPELLSYIQAIVDEKNEAGLFLLTGSHQLELHGALTQSLAGRIGLLTLLPFSIHELTEAGIELNLNEYLLTGFLPRIYDKNLEPSIVYRDYLKTYVERDVRQLINLKDLITFQRFLKLCASRAGTILNANNMANEIGVSNHTIKHWLSILEASFIIFMLPPYFENFGKRIIKSPKLYFFDVGLVAYLLNIETLEQVDRDPLRGNLVENLIVLELYKYRNNQGKDPNLYFYRDAQKNETDVIYKTGNELIPIEIKSSQTIHPRFLKGLDYFANIAKDRVSQGFVIYAGDQEIKMGEYQILNYKHSYKIFEMINPQ
jgi:predicted AAA+ superfamily ATPase